MPQDQFPGHGQDGEEPSLPRSGAGNGPGDGSDFDEAYLERLAEDLAAGRIQIPPESGEAAQGLSFIAAGPDDLAALGVEDLSGLDVAGFAQGGTADGMLPGAVLLGVAETACAPGTLQGLSDDQVLGLARATRRLAGLASWLQLAVAAEFTARRATGETIDEFASHELGPELVITDHAAEELMRHAAGAARRLPDCLAAVHAGKISEFQLKIAADATMCLSDADAAEADKLIAAAAPSLTPGMLRVMCTRTVMLIDPEAVKKRKDEAAKDARIEWFQEHSGTAALCGRDLPPDEVLASSTHIKAVALQLRRAGMKGTLRALRVRVYLDVNQGKNPLDRLTGIGQDTTPSPGETGQDALVGHDVPGGPDEDADNPDVWNEANYDEPEDADAGGNGGGDPRPGTPADPAGSGGRAAFPALINLLVPAGTLLGWSHAPGEAAGWGLLDPATTRDLAAAASRHPATRWCITVVGPDGTAAAHGCAAGRHVFDPQRYVSGTRDWPGARDGPPGPEHISRLAGLLGELNARLEPVAKGACDHRHHEDKYQPSRKLRHLVKARTARCVAPGCNRHAAECDADHTVPWPDGPSCECNLGPPCRRHHRCKQSPGWKLEQLSPGVMRWTGPSGRTHVTGPATYQL